MANFNSAELAQVRTAIRVNRACGVLLIAYDLDQVRSIMTAAKDTGCTYTVTEDHDLDDGCESYAAVISGTKRQLKTFVELTVAS